MLFPQQLEQSLEGMVKSRQTEVHPHPQTSRWRSGTHEQPIAQTRKLSGLLLVGYQAPPTSTHQSENHREGKPDRGEGSHLQLSGVGGQKHPWGDLGRETEGPCSHLTPHFPVIIKTDNDTYYNHCAGEN